MPSVATRTVAFVPEFSIRVCLCQLRKSLLNFRRARFPGFAPDFSPPRLSRDWEKANVRSTWKIMPLLIRFCKQNEVWLTLSERHPDTFALIRKNAVDPSIQASAIYQFLSLGFGKKLSFFFPFFFLSHNFDGQKTQGFRGSVEHCDRCREDFFQSQICFEITKKGRLQLLVLLANKCLSNI